MNNPAGGGSYFYVDEGAFGINDFANIGDKTTQVIC